MLLLSSRLLVLLLMLVLLRRAVRHIVIRHPPAAVLSSVAGQRLVVVVRFGILGDDVPCVQQAGEEAEHAEGDVDDGVGAAEAAFDPDYGYGEEGGLVSFWVFKGWGGMKKRGEWG